MQASHSSQSAMNSPASTAKAQPAPVALFVSDVHLDESLPKTTQAFLDFLEHQAVHCRQLYLLGDLFEYWAGDDDIDSSYNQHVIHKLKLVSDSGVEIFWMPGNRDFLVSEGFAKATGAALLADPHTTTIAGNRIVLTHGDAQCTDDTAYMAFRAQVREPQWQHDFLAMPLMQRKAIIAGMRDQSRAAQRTKSYDIMDVNQAAITSLFASTGADILIHGHTHRPARHEQDHDGQMKLRYVLPDWDADADAARGGWIGITADGGIRRYDLHGCELR